MNRTDTHSPANFNPADYAYVGSFDLGQPKSGQPEPTSVATRKLLVEEGWKEGNFHNRYTCDHCGAHFTYGCAYRHLPTGVVVAVGWTCSEERFGLDSRRDFDQKYLRDAAAERRRSEGLAARAAEFLDSVPGLRTALEVKHAVLANLNSSLHRYGSLTSAQVDLALRLAAEAKAREEAPKVVPTTPYPTGRQTVTARVVSTKSVDGIYGTQFKMLVELPTGHRAFGTVPASLDRTEKGTEVQFAAEFTPSQKDPAFGFFNRPTKARVLTATA